MHGTGVDFNAPRSLDRLLENMKLVRQPFEPMWRSVARLLMPMRPRFMMSGTGKSRAWPAKTIIDNTAVDAHRIMVAGLQNGMSNPTDKWLDQVVNDQTLMRRHDVVQWLQELRDVVLRVLNSTNYYGAFESFLKLETAIGTSAMLVLDHPEDISSFETFPMGSFYLGTTSHGKPNRCLRETSMTAEQMVLRFGLEHVSQRVKTAWKNEHFDDRFNVGHLIGRNPDFNADSPLAEHLPWGEVYWETGDLAADRQRSAPDQGPVKGDGTREILARSGYHEFPVMVGRWGGNLIEDVYASEAPGIESKGDAAMLQGFARTGINAIEKQTDPPMISGPEVRQNERATEAGAVTIDDGMTGSAPGMRELQTVTLDLGALALREEQARTRIRSSFFYSLFLRLTNDTRAQRATVAEINATLDEIARVLSPVLTRHTSDFFRPLVERVTSQVLRAAARDWDLGLDSSIISRPPADLAGAELNVEYSSQLSLAQRRSAVRPVQEHLAMVGEMEQIAPGSMDVLRTDASIRYLARMTGVPEHLHRSVDEVTLLRQQRAEAQKAAAAQEQIQPAAKAARDLSETQLEDGSSALDQLLKSP